MSYLYYLISFFVAILIGATYFIIKRLKPDVFSNKWIKIAKIVSLVLAGVFFFRYMLDRDLLVDVIGLGNGVTGNALNTAFGTLGAWFGYCATLLLILYPFFKNKMTTRLVKYFITPLVFFCFAVQTITSANLFGLNAVDSFNVRAVLLSVELGICLAYCTLVWKNNYKCEEKCTFKVVLFTILSAFGLLVATMPSYTLQNFFGYIILDVEIDELNLWHRIFVYFGFLIPLMIYFIFKKKDYETRRFVLLYIALGSLITFMCGAKFQSWLSPLSWPIHLCNTAMYIMPLCLIFKWNKLFYFSFFINVLGAFFAMVMPDTAGNMASYSVIHFWNNHYNAFFMPLLLVSLKMFPRPKLKEFIYSIVAFSVYFVAILIINAWFTNYGKCDFFFINSDFIAEKLGKWAEDLRLITVEFDINTLHFVFYPIYQALFYLVYVAMALGMWFFYEQCYNYIDVMYELGARRKVQKLEEVALMSKLNGRSKSEPVNPENSDKFILKNFTKRYGESEVYAVKDANLEVQAGEIFGFLGPNGAGKSTIIKTVVGIQPITSGEIQVCGYDVNTQGIEARQLIGYVPDHYALYEKLTGREYINYIADIYQVSQEDRDARINDMLKRFQLEFAFDNQMKTYSHGMKQKIAIMSALVHNPKIWILDEPLTGLDPNSIFQVKECMKEHARKGNVVFFSSHIIDVVERICDRIGIIKKGQIQCVAKVQDILDSGEPLEQFYMRIIEGSDATAIKVDSEILKDEKLKKKEIRKHQRAEEKAERQKRKEEKKRLKEQGKAKAEQEAIVEPENKDKKEG